MTNRHYCNSQSHQTFENELKEGNPDSVDEILNRIIGDLKLVTKNSKFSFFKSPKIPESVKDSHPHIMIPPFYFYLANHNKNLKCMMKKWNTFVFFQSLKTQLIQFFLGPIWVVYFPIISILIVLILLKLNQ